MNKCKTCVHNLVCCHLSDTDSDFYARQGYHYDFDNCPHYKGNDTTPTKFIIEGRGTYLKIVAPADITLKQLLKQCDRIKPAWHGCDLKSDFIPEAPTDIIIMYDSITKVVEDAPCTILLEDSI